MIRMNLTPVKYRNGLVLEAKEDIVTLCIDDIVEIRTFNEPETYTGRVLKWATKESRERDCRLTLDVSKEYKHETVSIPLNRIYQATLIKRGDE